MKRATSAPTLTSLADLKPATRNSPSAKDRVYCPECGGDLTEVYDPPKGAGEFAVCPKCAAVAAMAPEGYFRLLVTEEWWTLMVSPQYNDLMGARVAVVERLTAPGRKG